MNEALSARLKGFSRKEGASVATIAKVEEAFGRKLPDELRQILAASNGMSGTIGTHELHIWSADEIIAYNRANLVQEDCPAFLMFGSDGCGETYTLDYRSQPPAVVLVSAIGFDYESAIPIGKDFLSSLDRLKDSRSLFKDGPAA